MHISIRPAAEEDLPEIAFLESQIEGETAVSIDILRMRLAMFPEGFLVAIYKERIVGYIETCLWDKAVPSYSAEPSFFPRLHGSDKHSCYIIFVGVQGLTRRKGIGSRLVKGILLLAQRTGREKVQAVTRPDLVAFYEQLGFTCTRELPGFLPEGRYFLMEWSCDNPYKLSGQ